MFDENSPNGFIVHRENVNESENKNEIKVRGTTMFQNKEDYYPDYEKYSNQGNWNQETKESQVKLNEVKRNAEAFGTVINLNEDEDVVDPNTFFNNTSQVYLLYNLGEEFKK